MITSSTSNDPPPPFLPFKPTRQPGNHPNPPTPGVPSRTFTPLVENLKGVRLPLPIARDDSSCKERSVGFPVSVGVEMILPKTYVGSCKEVSVHDANIRR